MSTAKEAVLELVQQLPEDVTRDEIIERLYFQEQVEAGLRDVIEGRIISSDELRERIARWRKSAGR